MTALSAPSSRPRGVGYALGAAVLFGLSTPCAKRLLADTDPVLVAGLLYLGSGLACVPLLALGRRGTSRAIPRAQWRWLAGAVIAGGLFAPLCQMVGLRHTPAATAALLLNLEGVLTALVAWRAFRENIDRRVALGMFLVVAGGALLAFRAGEGVGLSFGALAIVGACLGWAVDNNLTQRVSGSDPFAIVVIKGLGAGTANTLLALGRGARVPSPGTVAATLALGGVSYGLSLALFVLALRHLGAARTGAYFGVAPFVGAGLAVLLLHEAPAPGFVPALVLMGVGVWLHLAERHEHEHLHAPVTHSHAHRHDDGHHDHPHDPPVDPSATHAHEHTHAQLRHRHAHYPDLHHRHAHESESENEHEPDAPSRS